MTSHAPSYHGYRFPPDDLVLQAAHVHHELLDVGFDAFREKLSDHVPVTVRVMVGADDD